MSKLLGSFDFQPRTRLVFGKGALSSLGELAREIGTRLGARGQAPRVLLVSDVGLIRAGHVERALSLLERGGMKAVLYDGVVENPTVASVVDGVKAARAGGVDLIVALGGGSVMDCAKGIGILLTSGGRIADYRGLEKLRRPLPALVAVPTTAGTGSEVQSAALISDSQTGEKMIIRDHRLAPRAALLDPALTLTMPPAVAAATGIDAISHAVESYVSTLATELSRMYARAAFRLLLPAFEKVLAVPGDLAARADMLLGASFAGLSIEHSMLGAAHSCANPLTSRYGIPHGVAVGVMLPHVVRYNGVDEATERRYVELAGEAGLVSPVQGVKRTRASTSLRVAPFVRRVGAARKAGPGSPRTRRARAGAAERLASHLESLLEKSGLPPGLRNFGVEYDRMGELAKEARSQWTAAFNPRPVKAEDLLEMYRWAY